MSNAFNNLPNCCGELPVYSTCGPRFSLKCRHCTLHTNEYGRHYAAWDAWRRLRRQDAMTPSLAPSKHQLTHLRTLRWQHRQVAAGRCRACAKPRDAWRADAATCTVCLLRKWWYNRTCH